MRIAALAILSLVVLGCGGPWYWTKPGATTETFQTDHQPCFQQATIAYGVGNEEIYKRCMRAKGWGRVQGYVNGPPPPPAFRGPESDEDFSPEGSVDPALSPRWTGDTYQCARSRGTLSQRPSPGVVCQ